MKFSLKLFFSFAQISRKRQNLGKPLKLQMSLISVACVMIILAGLKAAQAIVVPFLLAIFITVLVSPLVLYVQKICDHDIFLRGHLRCDQRIFGALA